MDLLVTQDPRNDDKQVDSGDERQYIYSNYKALLARVKCGKMNSR